MKTVISIPDPIYRAAGELAKKMKISLNDLFAAALVSYLNEYAKENITEALNRVYATEHSATKTDTVNIQAAELTRKPGIDAGKVIILPNFDAPLDEFA